MLTTVDEGLLEAGWSTPDRSPTGENRRCPNLGIFRLNGSGVPCSVPRERIRMAKATE